MASGNPFGVALITLVLVASCSESGGPHTRPPQAAPSRAKPLGAGAPPRAPTLAVVHLPARGDSPVTIEDATTRLRARFALASPRPGMASSPRLSAVSAPPTATVFFPGAGPDGSSVRFRVGRSGVEDFVEFARRPPLEEVRYRVDVHEAAGLRLVENVLELLDAAGTPRLRAAAPYVLDRNGRHDARVALLDCKADADPRGPWGRPVTAPGRPECTVQVAWGGGSGGSRVEYPAVLDPQWTATKSTMTRPRRGHTATLLDTGKVLVVGGESTAAAVTTYEKTAELFDPVTETFAATASLTTARSFHTAARVSATEVVIAGGVSDGAALASTEVYDVATPAFGTVGSLEVARTRAALVAQSGGALIAGGTDTAGTVLDSTEVFAAAAGTWKATGRMSSRRVGHYLAATQPGQALVVGGINSRSLGDLASCDFFAGGGTWSPAAGLAEPRHGFAGATFTDGRVLVAGGFQSSVGKALATAELLDGARWVKASVLSEARAELTLTALPGGAVAVGGLTRDAQGAVTAYSKTVDLFDLVARTWVPLLPLGEARAFHTATRLPDGRVLVTGGESTAGASATAEILAFDADGTACTVSATCASGVCIDGVCCHAACDGTCLGCAATLTGQASGTCAPVLAGKDPRGDCADDGAPACTRNGACDGSGACASYPSKRCTPEPCAKGSDCKSGSCADGICCDTACKGACEACTAEKKGTGGDGVCGPVANGTDPDAECLAMGSAACAGDGVCDGSRACRVPAAGKACAPASCVDDETLGGAATCTNAGACKPKTTTCVPFLCDAAAAACTDTCSKDADCATGAHCKSGICARSENGAACKAPTDCTSVSCVDGVCCNTACDGQCEACDVAGKEGACTAVVDAPRGTRDACAGESPCGGHCNGLLRTACVYPNSDTECGDDEANDAAAGPSCRSGSETRQRCNGLGTCLATPRSCSPFACGENACNTDCSEDAECAAGFHCRDGTCTTDEPPTCADGGAADGGACKPPSGGSSSGCGCRTAVDGNSGLGSATALLGIVALALSRRRSPRRRDTLREPRMERR